ncbi:related to pyridoxine 4-dehydrogenase [Fusarium oxysporum]|uniref:Related to pyridoxine 4-dehydrogenase n=1 Tax=Fusarium oxysporum TaxID=5507 RepID=A0A2H3TJW2_FUSOX|nr:related to pyridoxine 4-dehydrogenase [Fusarium oxysporum]
MASPVKLPTRKLGRNGPEVAAIGLGLMGLSIGYGKVDSDEERLKVLDRAWELGSTNWDSARAYGDSEDLLGKWFALHPERRQDIFLATKFGIDTSVGVDGKLSLTLDSSPEHARKACEQSLKRLGVGTIDLYYIHRLDGKTPIERTIEELVKLKNEGKIKYLGISECSSQSLRRAYAVHPIHAVQVEYNPWTLDIEGAPGTHLLRTARELGVAIVAYSPLGRGIMTGKYTSIDAFDKNDFRRLIPRYQGDNFAKNLTLVNDFEKIAAEKGITPAQGDDIVPIPGTKKIKYLEENTAALNVDLSPEDLKKLRDLVDAADIKGNRGTGGTPFADTPEP